MGQQFCTACGAKLTGNMSFCEHCGARVEQGTESSLAYQVSQKPQVPEQHPPPSAGTIPVVLVAGIIIVLVLIGAGVLFILPALQNGELPAIPGTATTVPTIIPTPEPTPIPAETTVLPTRAPDPFPGARALKERVPFGEGSVASEATVYRYWINDTYQWHNDMDNRYYTQKPGVGNKYLFVFVQMMNLGDTRVWLPPAGSIVVHYDGRNYFQDYTHYKPDKSSDRKATAVEIKEVEYLHKLNGDEYVEDFGFSHGTELGYIYPGKSNAVDGYIIYEVPQSLSPETTYVTIRFNGEDYGVWRLV